MKPHENNWHTANQAYLVDAIRSLRSLLQGDDDEMAPGDSVYLAAGQPPALERLRSAFGLSIFERNILLACAAVELDSSFAELFAAAQRDPRRAFPTFGLALSRFPDPHWSALSPERPLRRWRLIDVAAGDSLTASPLRIDEQILHYLAGVRHLDERLNAMVEHVAPAPDIPTSQRAQAHAIVSAWTRSTGTIPVVQLCGDEHDAKRELSAVSCLLIDAHLYSLPSYAVPNRPAELDAFMRLWQREAMLNGSVLLIDCDHGNDGDIAREGAIARIFEQIRGCLILTSRSPRRSWRRPSITLDVGKPTSSEQRAMWRELLGEATSRLNGSLDAISAQFDFGQNAIRTACTEALQTQKQQDLSSSLWEACRAQARPQLDDLAQRIQPAATWDDLVLPDTEKKILRDIEVHVRQRTKVYQTWGFASRGSRGLGISALFAGPSGTGKTMAGEVLANQLRLDLYRIDLSQVVSKYIGETEKNLRRVFDAAEAGCAILLFDEADALFGKRSEVKDSHDRYANVEVSYLLQRMEAYRGLAILTTNMKTALDEAFQRRLRFVVQFPFPHAEQRAQIWRRIFPAQTPLASLDYERLARLQVSGGNIRNIAMNGAFLAAEADEPVGMTHLVAAARSEYAKLERPLAEADLGGRP